MTARSRSGARRVLALCREATTPDGSAYHTTGSWAAHDIAADGAMKTYGPSHGTPGQRVWPDGGAERRVYFARTEAGTDPFWNLDSGGHRVVLRVPVGRVPLCDEGRGLGLFSRRPVSVETIEIRGASGWIPLRSWAARPNPRTAAQRPSARRRPMPFPAYDLAVGDSLWWAAHDPRIWGEPVQWFTDNPSTAREYMEGRYGKEGDWATMYFDVRRAARLVHMRDWGDLDRLARFLRVDHDGDPHDIAPALCAAGYDGWWIDEGEFDGADVMLCNPREHVAELHLVDQGDGWTGEDPRPNPSRRRRPSSPSTYADPGLWQQAKEEALRRAGGRHSARAMQTAGVLYRAAGGRYRGPPTAAQRSLAKWTYEGWTTATGERACRQTARGTRCDRYLPRAAWQDLTPAQALATRRAKLRAASQYVPNTPAARAAGRRARTAPRPNPGRPLHAQLAELRPQMAAAAQAVYDDWGQNDDGFDEEFGEGGICDRVAEALWRVIDNGIPDVEIRDGGWDGDDHAYLIAQRGQKAFVVDIPPRVYETGGGYSWRKRKGVRFDAADVVIEETDAVDE